MNTSFIWKFPKSTIINAPREFEKTKMSIIGTESVIYPQLMGKKTMRIRHNSRLFIGEKIKYNKPVKHIKKIIHIPSVSYSDVNETENIPQIYISSTGNQSLRANPLEDKSQLHKKKKNLLSLRSGLPNPQKIMSTQLSILKPICNRDLSEPHNSIKGHKPRKNAKLNSVSYTRKPSRLMLKIRSSKNPISEKISPRNITFVKKRIKFKKGRLLKIIKRPLN